MVILGHKLLSTEYEDKSMKYDSESEAEQSLCPVSSTGDVRVLGCSAGCSWSSTMNDSLDSSGK